MVIFATSDLDIKIVTEFLPSWILSKHLLQISVKTILKLFFTTHSGFAEKL